MIIAVGDGDAVGAAARELAARLATPLMTFERVRVCKRDGVLFAKPREPPEPGVRQKLMVYAGETLYDPLVRGLRDADVAGATALRGIWGYHGDHAPHGERFWSLRRHVPVLTVVVDTPERMRRTFAVVDSLTSETGLVTSELVPVYEE